MTQEELDRLKELNNKKKLSNKERRELATLQKKEERASKKETSGSFSDGLVEYPITMICINDIDYQEYQDRTGFDKDHIKDLSDSIKKQGLLQPILVKDLGNNKFLKIAGRHRIEAYKLLGKDKIEAIVLPENTSSVDILLKTYHENTKRTDYHVLDKIRFHMNFFEQLLSLDTEEIRKLINKNKNRKNELNEEEVEKINKMEEALVSLSSYNNLITFQNNLYVLDMEDIIIERIINKEIVYTTALLLHRFFKKSDFDTVKKVEIIDHIVDNNMGAKEIKEYIKSFENKIETKVSSAVKKINNLVKNINDEDKLAKIEEFIKSLDK